MKGMKFSIGVLALLAIGLVGCGKGDTNNAPAPDANKASSSDANNSGAANNPSGTNAPSGMTTPAANNAPEANHAPGANQSPEANNAPVVNNSPVTTPKDGKKPGPMTPIGPVSTTKKGDSLLPSVTPRGQDGWKKVSADAKKITAAVDSRVKVQKDMKMAMDVLFEMPTGHGTLSRANMIADQKRFKLEYGLYSTKPVPHYETYFVIKKKGDTKYSTFDGDHYVSGRTATGPDILGGWILNPTLYLGSGIGTELKPLTQLVQTAEKAKWTIGVEEKKIENVVYQRIIIESSSQPAKRIELMIHPTKLLPVQINASILGTHKTNSMMRIQWLQSNTPLTDADLSPAVKTAPTNVISEEEGKRKGLKPIGN